MNLEKVWNCTYLGPLTLPHLIWYMIKPNSTDKREIYLLWTDITDIFLGPARNWPIYYRSFFFWTKNIKYFQRYRLAIFIFTNSLPIDLFSKWWKLMGLLRDQSALTHMRSLLLICFTSGDYGSIGYSYSIVSGKWQYLNGQNVIDKRKH